VNETTPPLLAVRNLTKHFRVKGDVPLVSKTVHALDGISLDLASGTSIGIAGESGSGKTTLARCVMSLEKPTAGQILFQGRNVKADRAAFRQMRRSIQMVFQDPAGSLNPRFTVERTLREPFLYFSARPRGEHRQLILRLLEQVGIGEPMMTKLPHQLSGGQQQRVSIARALAPEPSVLILDEPTSALDVSLQAQIVNLLERLREELDLAYILITHQLSIVRQLCESLMIMYLGKPMETGPTSEILDNPRHPYSRALMDSIPVPDPFVQVDIPQLAGEIPSPIDPPSGCRFHPRCIHEKSVCRHEEPFARQVEGVTVWCHLFQ
jgi:oligopeptide transport system ATP-binding protein